MPQKTKKQLEAELEALKAKLDQTITERRVLVGVRIPESLRDQINDAAHADKREIQAVWEEAARNWVRARERRINRNRN